MSFLACFWRKRKYVQITVPERKGRKLASQGDNLQQGRSAFRSTLTRITDPVSAQSPLFWFTFVYHSPLWHYQAGIRVWFWRPGALGLNSGPFLLVTFLNGFLIQQPKTTSGIRPRKKIKVATIRGT